LKGQLPFLAAFFAIKLKVQITLIRIYTTI
jgi:hypothetical protein